MEEMGRLEFATPREAWGGEAEAFTPLLGTDEMLAYLGRATGIGRMTVVETEYATAGGRSLDILAETADERRVAIENQYGRGDHDHFTRGLAYAVASGAKALVVVAEDHRDEFVSVAEYLNDVAATADEVGISVWLVKVRAVRRQGDDVWSPEFIVQAQPNEWEAAIRRETAPKLASLEDFYEKCRENVSEDWANAARVIIEDWVGRDGAREDHNTKSSVALYYRDPRHGDRGSNVMQVWTSGDLFVCRSYIWEVAGVFDPDHEPSDLDEEIRKWFPNARWPAKKAYISQRETDPVAVQGFGDWLATQFDEAIED